MSNDWIVVALAMIVGSLACQPLFAGAESHRSFATIVQASLCVASLVVFLLANDGAYRGDCGPLRIKQAEHVVRVCAQASLLIVVVNFVAGITAPRIPIEISLLAATLFLIAEKPVLSLLTAALAARVVRGGRAPKSRWNCRVQNLARSVFCDVEENPAPVQKGSANAVGRRYEILKRIFDLILAMSAIVATLPVWMVAAILIRIDSPGPVLFRQQRVGRNGRLFRIYKFRSMRTDAPQYAVSPNQPTDSRITSIGRFLRQCSLDELPQLLNVIKGDMSLVGPRPEMPFLVEQHRAEHQRRLQVVPGMTGLWQLSSARAFRIHENVHFDHYYVQNRSLSMDFAILLYTPVRLMRGI